MNLTETPKKARFLAGLSLGGGRRHRLYVVLPLFLFLSWAGIGGPSTASVTPSSSYVQSGSLIVGKSLITVDAQGYALTGWNGAFVADAAKNDQLTIVALTTPVLVQRDGDAWLVPVGMQLSLKASSNISPADITEWMHSRRPLPLPAHYLREMLPTAEALWAQSSIKPLTAKETVMPPLAGSALMFNKARTDAESDVRAQRLARLSDALIQHDPAAFDELMSMSDTRDILDHAEVSDLATLLTLAADSKRDVQILPSILRDPSLSLLLRFHPLLRSRVWLTAEASADHHLLLLGQMLLPFSDHSEATVSPQSIQSWEDGWKAVQLDAVSLNALAPIVAHDIAVLDEEGYPVRARGYAAAFVSGVHPLPAGVSDDAQAALDHLRSIYDIVLSVADPEPQEVPVVPETNTSSAVSSVSSVVTVVSEADVRAMLSAEGCMFTTQTVFTSQPDGLYQVQDVVLGTPSGDRVISFTFNPAARTVLDIEQNGQILPYSLTLEKYVEWVRNQ